MNTSPPCQPATTSQGCVDSGWYPGASLGGCIDQWLRFHRRCGSSWGEFFARLIQILESEKYHQVCEKYMRSQWIVIPQASACPSKFVLFDDHCFRVTCNNQVQTTTIALFHCTNKIPEIFRILRVSWTLRRMIRL